MKYMLLIKALCFILLAINFDTCFSIELRESSKEITDKSHYKIIRSIKDVAIEFKRGTIQISNDFGDVHIKNTKDHSIGISVVAQEIGDRPAIHDLNVKSSKNKIKIKVAYNKKDLKAHIKSRTNLPIGRVDLVVFIPVDLKIDVSTTFGAIDIRRAKNPIKAESKSGKIDISTFYDMDVYSESGRIKAFAMSINWEKGVKLVTQTGDIFAVVPNEPAVKLNIHSKGRVFSRMESPESWKEIANEDYNNHKIKDPNYLIKTNRGKVYISPHEKIK